MPRFTSAANCAHCNYDIPADMKDTSNDTGLSLDYALEIVWMVYPPEATGLDAKKRYLWMKPVADGEGGDVAFMGKCSNTLFGLASIKDVQCSIELSAKSVWHVMFMDVLTVNRAL